MPRTMTTGDGVTLLFATLGSPFRSTAASVSCTRTSGKAG